jgi:2-polyprenyl-3-methyl-5-hydroxy-6-metoxy-1,4-benzoquinol methylase
MCGSRSGEARFYSDMTIDYYNENAQQYFDDTVKVDMGHIYDLFLSHLPVGRHILDAGCGSGRDSRAFILRGYQVTAFDASTEMVLRARQLTGLDIRKCTFEEFNELGLFDGIWTCATLLHVPYNDLLATMEHLAKFLKIGGVWYMSFKKGTGERIEKGRLFTHMDKIELRRLVGILGEFDVESIWTSQDTRPERSDIWLNTILKKRPAL